MLNVVKIKTYLSSLLVLRGGSFLQSYYEQLFALSFHVVSNIMSWIVRWWWISIISYGRKKWNAKISSHYN